MQALHNTRTVETNPSTEGVRGHLRQGISVTLVELLIVLRIFPAIWTIQSPNDKCSRYETVRHAGAKVSATTLRIVKAPYAWRNIVRTSHLFFELSTPP